MGTKNTILIQIWFGPIPDYFWYHYETTKNLNGFDFLFITDQLDFNLDSENYRVMYLDKFSLENLLYVKTKHRIKIPNNKKICDLKASLGDLFYNDIKDYEYFGFYDIDTLFGDINKINKYQIQDYDVITFANTKYHNRVGGPFTIIKNNESLRKLYLNDVFIDCFNNENVTCYEEHDWSDRVIKNYKLKIVDSTNLINEGGKINYDVVWSGNKLYSNNEEILLYHFLRKNNTVLNKVGNKIFAKYNKTFLSDFCWVIGFTENYSQDIEYVMESLQKYSNMKCIIYSINFEYKVPNDFITSEQFIFRTIEIPEGQKDSRGRDENIISSKPKIMIDVIDTFPSENFVFVDSDVYFTTCSDDIKCYIKELENHPLINSHIHDRLYLTGIRENEEWTDTVDVLAKASNIEITVFPRRKTNIMIFNKSSRWFFQEQIDLYEKYKNTEPGIFVLHDEDSANVVLSKHNLHKSLHLCDLEECNNLDISKYTDLNHPFHMTGISEFVVLPKHKNDIYIFHGLKNTQRYVDIKNQYGNSSIDCEEILVKYENGNILFEKNSFLDNKTIPNNVDFLIKDFNENILFQLENQQIHNYWFFFISNVHLEKNNYIVNIVESDTKVKIYNNVLSVK